MSGDKPSSDSTATLPGPPGLERGEIMRITLEMGLRPVAIAGMLTCIAIALAQVVAKVAPTWPGTFFTLFVFLACLESIHSQRTLAERRLSSRDRFRFRFVEWAVILLAARLGVYTSLGMERLQHDIALWSVDMSAFFDVMFVVNSALILVFWLLAAKLAQAIQELDATPIERMPSVTDPDFYLRSTMPHHGRTDRQARLGRITTIFFWGGALLLLLNGMAQVDVRELVLWQHGRSSGIILNALVYFIIGFLLVSQAQYAIHKANWDLQGIPVLGRLGRRWVLLVLAFLLLVGGISALLPVNYSVGIMDVVATVVRWVAYVVIQAAFFVLFIFGYLIGFILSLFRGRPQEGAPAEMRQAIPPPPPEVGGGEPAAWWQVVRSLLFWAVLTGVVGYSLWHFVGDRWGVLRFLSGSRLAAWATRFWQRLRRNTRRAARRLREAINRRLAAQQAHLERATRNHISLRRLSPRQRVRYFYLSVLHRSAQQGFGRSPSTTPLEYARTLAEQIPEEDADVRAFTEAFVVARYSERSITREDAAQTQTVWNRLKRALIAKRREKDKA